MAYALIASTKIGSLTTGGTTPAIDTSGSNLLIATIGWFPIDAGTPQLIDSKGNVWTPLTKRAEAVAICTIIFWSVPTSVGSGHTFTLGNGATTYYPSMEISAWSGAHASPFDQETGAGAAFASTIQPGSLTPAENDCLLIAGLSHDNNSAGAVSIGGGFTIAQAVAHSADTFEGSAQAYLIQTTAAAANPTWNITNSSVALAAALASFKAAAAAAPTSLPPRGMTGGLHRLDGGISE